MKKKRGCVVPLSAESLHQSHTDVDTSGINDNMNYVCTERSKIHVNTDDDLAVITHHAETLFEGGDWPNGTPQHGIAQ